MFTDGPLSRRKRTPSATRKGLKAMEREKMEMGFPRINNPNPSRLTSRYEKSVV